MSALEQSRTRRSGGAGDTWADRLARCRLPEGVAHQTPVGKPLLDALAVMWELFDQACRQANEAMDRVGVPERITVWRADNERRYCMAGPDGGSRTISVFVNVPVVQEHISGGVEISNSQSRQPISLVPVLEAGLIRWQVAPLGVRFDEDLVRNLFLSVFGDDPVATALLSPLCGIDTFESPWS
jgi:hypothetical protein